MTTPTSVASWQPGLFTTVRVVVALACLLLVMPAAGAQPVSSAASNHFVLGARSVGEFLNPDGTLALPIGQATSLDPRGYQLISRPGEAPRFAPASPDTVPGDENWASGLFPLPGTNGNVYALVVATNGDVYVGGDFTIAGGVLANRIARWDGSTWSALGSGVRRCYPGPCVVRALALDAAGSLYVGGWFTRAGDVDANSIAKWDGNAWSSLGSGMDAVEALAIDAAGNLYAGGTFSSAGGVSANNIARWDGSSWSPLETGINDRVYALAIDAAGNLYAGGTFSSAGGVSANNIAKWNGSTWLPLGNGMDGEVADLVFDAAGNLYAGGGFTTAGGINAKGIAKWNGSGWSSIGGMEGCDTTNCVFSLALDAVGNLYAGGTFRSAGGISAFRIARWDGTIWAPLGSGIDCYVLALAVDATGAVYAGGFNSSVSAASTDRIAKWDGSVWSPLGDGLNDVVQALAVDAVGNLYVGGNFTIAGGQSANYIAKWDGVTWSTLGGGMDGSVHALTFDASGNLYAGGTFRWAGGVSAIRIARWDGTSWFPLDGGVWGCSSYGCAVYALAVDTVGNIYAGGDFTAVGNVTTNGVAKWNGSTWTPLGSGVGACSYRCVSALAFDSHGNLYAGGSFTAIGGVSANYIAKWNGVIWSSLDDGLGDRVRALAIGATGNLYAACSRNDIHIWDGAAWSGVYTNVESVFTLAFDEGGYLYAGGSDDDGDTIGRWDGATWSWLGSGMGGDSYPQVNTMVVDTAGNLYAAGDFDSAGNQVSAFVARWTAADGARSVSTGNYTFYTNNLPVSINVVTPGTLDQLALQRVNRSHPQAPPELATGYYWQVTARDANNHPATGYAVDLTLPTTFTADDYDQVCRFTGAAWNCAANAHASDSITRTRITNLSDWTAGNYPPPDPPGGARYLPLMQRRH